MIISRRSTDFAATFAAKKNVGDSAGGFVGLATSKKGVQVLAGSSGQTNKASSGGSYSAYGTAHAQGAYFIPRYIFTSTSSDNDSSSPEYLLFAPILDSGESMWRVTAGGNTFFDITPIRSGTEGLAVGYRCAEMPWRSGAIILAVAEFGGAVRRLCVSLTSGSSWTFSEVLADGALAVTTRKSDIKKREAYIANGSRLGYCADYQAATPLITEKNIGVESDLLFVEVYE